MVKRSNNCELTTSVREKITPSHTARFEKSPSRSVACSVCWLPSRPHGSITDNRDSSSAMEALPSTDFSIICELFINDLLGILSDSTATHMVHFFMSLLVSCIYTFAPVFPVCNLALKHCLITYGVTKWPTFEYNPTNTCLILATTVINQYLRNFQNIQLSHYLQICKIYLVTQPRTFGSHPDEFEIKRVCFLVIISNNNNCLLQHRREVSTLLPFAIKIRRFES